MSVSETLRAELAAYGSPIGVSVLCPSATTSNVMESERGRPASRGVEQRTDDTEGMRLAIRSMFDSPSGLPAATVAARTVEAVRAREFWIITHGGERPIVESRLAEVLAAFPTPRT